MRLRNGLKMSKHKQQHLFGQTSSDFFCSRRILIGSAKNIFRMSHAHTWADLHQVLIDEFGNTTTNQQVYDKLKKRFRSGAESLHHYILSMQEIAQHGNVNELDLLHLIVSGLRDNSSAVSVLHAASSL